MEAIPLRESAEAPKPMVMATNLQAMLESIDRLPVMPAVAARVLAFEDDVVSVVELSEVLSADPALTVALLKVANSAYYGFARQLSTVREAVLLLGFKQVRQVAVGASMIHAWRGVPREDDGFDLDLFWGHSMAVALMAETAARKFNAARPEEAFTAGVIHDMGVLALRKVYPAEFALAFEQARRQGAPLCDAELEFVGFTHAQVGAALAERWRLPSRLVEAVGRHHDALLTPGADGLAGVLGFADQVAEHYGVHCGYARGQIVPLSKLPDELATLEIACGGISSVLERSCAFISSVSGAPKVWYPATRAA